MQDIARNAPDCSVATVVGFLRVGLSAGGYKVLVSHTHWPHPSPWAATVVVVMYRRFPVIEVAEGGGAPAWKVHTVYMGTVIHRSIQLLAYDFLAV